MKLLKIAKKAAECGPDFWCFLTTPREFVRTEVLGAEPKPLGEILAWSISAGALIWGLYSWVADSPFAKLDRAVRPKPEEEPSVRYPVQPGAKIQFKTVTWQAGFSLGVDFPEVLSKGWNVPQVCVLDLGMGEVILDNVAPSTFRGIAGKLVLLLYAVLTVASLHLPARVAGAQASFSDEVRLGCIFFLYMGLLATSAIVFGTVALVDLAKLNARSLSVTWPLVVIIPVLAIMVRCFFAGFSELYSVSKKRVFLIGLGSVFVSWAISPIVFAPAVFVILRFKDLLEVIV